MSNIDICQPAVILLNSGAARDVCALTRFINILRVILAHPHFTENSKMPEKNVQLEKIIRPIVEGQIRGFLKEHSSVLDGVDWYKPRKDDKATTFTNSLAKRIVRDLTCGSTAARLAKVFVELAGCTPSNSTVEPSTAAKPTNLEPSLGWWRRLFWRAQ